MKHLLCLLAAVFVSAAAEAAPRINQGNWIVGGSTSLSFASGSSTSFSLTPEAQYFLIDNISAGLAASLYTTSGYSSLVLSPEASFHMLAGATVIPYLTVKPIELTTFTGSTTYYSSAGRLGVKFFLTDSVAIGPAFELRHYWPHNGSASSDVGTLLGVFTIHI